MIYSYLRVSTDKQTIENQRFEVSNYATQRNIQIDEFIEETASGKIDIKNRALGKLLKKLKKGDTLIVSELSRLGRSLLDVMDTLNSCIKREIKIFSIKENFELGDNINSKVIAFAFSLAAEIERQMISQRTKEGLARRRAEGVILGRPVGRQNGIEFSPCHPHGEKILRWIDEGYSQTKIAKKLHIHKDTLRRWLRRSGNAHLLPGRSYIKFEGVTYGREAFKAKFLNQQGVKQ